MIKLNFNDDVLTITTDCGCVIASGSLYQEADQICEYKGDSCHCLKHTPENMILAAWMTATWEFNFPNGFSANAPDGFMGEIEGFVNRESFDKALHFVECFKSVKPLPVRAAA